MTHPRSMLCPVILGRDDLLDRIDHLIDDATQGRGHTLFLSGQAGIGKTRLIGAATRKAEVAGFRADGGSVAPQDHQVPLASIRDMAAGMRANAAWGTLSEDLLQINGRITGDALGSRRVIVRSVSDRILAAIDRPTMLVFDDLHWTDEMSLEVVGELARHAAGLPLFLVGAYRADEFPAGTIHREWRARLLGQRHAEEARLRRLTEAETASAITLILGGELPAPRDVVEAVLQRTNGIPLHVEELLAALPPAAFADGRLIRDAHVPDTIGDAILARFSRLSDDARLVARAGAVIGRCFSPDVLAGVLGRPLSDLEPTVQQLVDAAILYPFDFVDHGYYDFRHQLLRDAIYGDVPPSQLRRFHAHAAELVMGLESGSIIHASRHYERAGLRTEAYRAAMSGAVEASRIAAKQEALELYRRAIDNMPDDLPAGERAELFRAYAETGLAIERIDDALPAAREARRWFLHASRTAEAAAMLVAIANGERKNGIASLEQRRSLIAQGLSEIEFAGSDPLVEGTRAQLLSFRSLTEFDAANFDEAARQNDGYLGIAKALGNHEMELDAEFMGGMIALARGEDEATLGRIVDIAHEARAAGYESVGVTSFRVAATMAARVMDYEAAAAAIGEGLEYADAIEQSHCRQQMAATSALVEWAHGDWDAASRRARQEAVERGCRRGALGAIPVIGFVAMGRGEVDEARHWLGDALAEAREIDDIEMVLPPLWGLAELALIIGEPAVAFARSEEALGIAQRTGERPLFVPFAVTGVRAALALHRPDDARRWLATCRGHLQGWTMAQAALHHGDGLVALAEGHLTVAHESLGAAADGWLHLGRVWERSTALLDQAQCLLRANRYAEATSLIAVVHEIAAALGSQPLLSRAQALKRLERGRGGLEERWYPLTAREFEVARRVTQGLTNPEIAEELKVTPRTISAHIEHILDKLDVGRRSEIAAWAASVAGPEPAVVQPDARGAHALAAVR